MELVQWEKAAFFVLGKEGSTEQGEGFVQRLWQQANAEFSQVEPLALRDAAGGLVGIWGAMTDFSRRFLPWEQDFSRGLYLAGVECRADALPPAGWAKWRIPAFRWLCAEQQGAGTFRAVLAELGRRGLPLVGAVQEFTCPASGKSYLLFPVARLEEEP